MKRYEKKANQSEVIRRLEPLYVTYNIYAERNVLPGNRAENGLGTSPRSTSNAINGDVKTSACRLIYV